MGAPLPPRRPRRRPPGSLTVEASPLVDAAGGGDRVVRHVPDRWKASQQRASGRRISTGQDSAADITRVGGGGTDNGQNPYRFALPVAGQGGRNYIAQTGAELIRRRRRTIFLAGVTPRARSSWQISGGCARGTAAQLPVRGTEPLPSYWLRCDCQQLQARTPSGWTSHTDDGHMYSPLYLGTVRVRV